MNIILLLLVLVVFGVLLNLVNRGLFNRGKRIYWLMGSYVAVLLIAVGLHLFVVEKATSKAGELNKDEIPNLEEVAYGNRSLDTITPYLVDELTFDNVNDEITLYSFEPDYSYVPVLIERTADDENVIEVDIYQVPTIIEGTDVTEQMFPFGAELIEKELFLRVDGYMEVNLNVYKNDFPMRQFIGETIFADNDFSYSTPSRLVHVRVPEHIKLNVDDDVIDYYMD